MFDSIYLNVFSLTVKHIHIHTHIYIYIYIYIYIFFFFNIYLFESLLVAIQHSIINLYYI